MKANNSSNYRFHVPFYLYCEQSIKIYGSVHHQALKICHFNHPCIIDDFHPSSNARKFSYFCCKNRLFYKLAGFNHPSISSNAEQWVSSISKGRSVIEFTFSEGFCTCANVSRTCLTNDRISGSPSFWHFPHAQRTMTQGMSAKYPLLFGFIAFLLPRVHSQHLVN